MVNPWNKIQLYVKPMKTIKGKQLNIFQLCFLLYVTVFNSNVNPQTFFNFDSMLQFSTVFSYLLSIYFLLYFHIFQLFIMFFKSNLGFSTLISNMIFTTAFHFCVKKWNFKLGFIYQFVKGHSFLSPTKRVIEIELKNKSELKNKYRVEKIKM